MNFDRCEFCSEETFSKQGVAENKFAKLLYPLRPIIFGHFMVVPKRHDSIFIDLSDEELIAVRELIKQIYSVFQKRNNAAGFNLLNNSGQAAGQHVYHGHIHVFIRAENDISPFDILSKKIEKEKLTEEEWVNRLTKIKSWVND